MTLSEGVSRRGTLRDLAIFFPMVAESSTRDSYVCKDKFFKSKLGKFSVKSDKKVRVLWETKQLLKYVLAEILPHLFYFLEFEQNVRNIAMLYIHNVQLGEKTTEDFITF